MKEFLVYVLVGTGLGAFFGTLDLFQLLGTLISLAIIMFACWWLLKDTQWTKAVKDGQITPEVYQQMTPEAYQEYHALLNHPDNGKQKASEYLDNLTKKQFG